MTRTVTGSAEVVLTCTNEPLLVADPPSTLTSYPWGEVSGLTKTRVGAVIAGLVGYPEHPAEAGLSQVVGAGSPPGVTTSHTPPNSETSWQSTSFLPSWA